MLTVAEVDEPHADPGETRIVVRTAGVTPADWYPRSGRLRDYRLLALPHVPGIDAAGIVNEIGDAVFGLTSSATVESAVPEA